MTRPYPFQIKTWLRAGAALTLTAALAGCGSSGTGSPPSSSASGSSPATHSGGTSGPSAATHGQTHANGAAGTSAGTSGDGVFVPVVASLGQVTGGSSAQLTHASGSQATHSGLPGTVPGSVGVLSAGGSSSASSPPPPSGGSGSSGSSSSGSGHTSAGAGKQPSAGGSGTSTPSAPPAKTKIVIVTKYQTIVRTVAPDIPAGAVLPSTHVVSYARFAVGRNIVCAVAAGGARCDINHRSWLPSIPKPGSCHRAWGRVLEVTGTAKTSFLCTNGTLFWGHPVQVQRGYDDVVGVTRCEVRSFGVNCFVAREHGFLISRSGYLRY